MSKSAQSEPESKTQNVNPVKLGAILSEYFNLADLESLSFVLSFEFDELGEGGRTTKSIRLVKYFERNGRLLELAKEILKERPSLTWDELIVESGDDVENKPDMAAGKRSSYSNADVDNYVHSLEYDPEILLGMQSEALTESPPVVQRQVSGNAVILCTKQDRSLRRNLNGVTILRPTGGIIYPGAILVADQNLMEGRPTPISLNRGPITLAIDLPGLPDKPAPIPGPTNSSVQSYLNDILEKWNENPASQGYANAARSSLQLTTAYCPQQIALDLNFSADWAGGEVAAKLELSSDTERSVAMALYRQVFYSATMDTPPTPSAVFAEDIDLEQIKRAVRDDAVPAYVRSVEYGRILMIIMETTALDTKVNLETALKQTISSGSKIGANVDRKVARIVENATFSVLEVGGGASTAAEFSGNADDIESLRHFITNDATYRRDNPGTPISYTVAFLKDNTLAKMGFATDYTEKEYVRYPNGFVKLHHDGAYVARWTVSWEEADQNGNYVARSWSSGKQTAGYVHQVDLPGDSKKVKIYAEAATGLAWDPWGEAINVTEDGPTNKTYRIFGTTLKRKYEIISLPN